MDLHRCFPVALFQQICCKCRYRSKVLIQARENSIEKLASICQAMFVCFDSEKLVIEIVHVAVGVKILLALKIGVIGFDDSLRGMRVNILEDNDA